MNEDYPKTAESLSLDELDSATGGVRAAAVEADGTVLEVLPNACFSVELDNGDRVDCHMWGKLRMNYVRIMPGDRVKLEIVNGGPFSSRIVWRYK